MKIFKNTEKLMTLRSRNANPCYAKAYEDMLTVYRFIDRRDKSCHCRIINALYNNRHYTYERIALDFSISDNALRRYREQYANLFSFYLNEQNLHQAV